MAKVKVDLGVAEVIGKVKDTETINQADKTTALLIRAVHAALSPLEKWVLQKESNIEQTRKLLEKKLKNVPVENIITPPMYIGVPALQAISYCMNDESLRNMYAELLAHAMNSDTVDNVHPTYVEIIKQMSPYDALIFQNLVKELVKPCISLRYEKMDASGYPIIDCFAFADIDSFPIIPTQISLENLERLRLIEINKNFHYSNENKYRELRQSTGLNKMLEEYVIDNENNLPSNEYKIVASEFAIMVRGFGQFFARACLGTNFSDIS